MFPGMVRFSLMTMGLRPCLNIWRSAPNNGFLVSRVRPCFSRQAKAQTSHISRLTYVQKSNAALSTDQSVTPWIAAYTEAEKIVGPLTSLAGMKNLLGDELANVGIYAQRLLESGHPIIQRTRGLVFDVNSARQLRGLVILLLSQAMGASVSGTDVPISLRQRSLAEITELIFAANVLHDGVMEINNQPKDLEKGLKFGNKITILGGDFLLASACTALSRLHSAEVVKLISNAIASAVEGSSQRTNAFVRNPESAYFTYNRWLQTASLSSGYVMAQSCCAAAVLADKDDAVKTIAELFGMNFGLGYQLKAELDLFHEAKAEGDGNTMLHSAPVMIANDLAADSQCTDILLALHAKPTKLTADDCAEIASIVDCYGATQSAVDLCSHHMELAITALQDLPQSHSLDVMKKLLSSFSSVV
eukprot:m.282438 g.282438  ORF g.282438 m.282438 type:complete len:418 (+) comp19848_c0_seq11:379-1632(+)